MRNVTEQEEEIMPRKSHSTIKHLESLSTALTFLRFLKEVNFCDCFWIKVLANCQTPYRNEGPFLFTHIFLSFGLNGMCRQGIPGLCAGRAPSAVASVQAPLIILCFYFKNFVMVSECRIVTTYNIRLVHKTVIALEP